MPVGFRQLFFQRLLAASHSFQPGVGGEPWTISGPPWKNPPRARIRDAVLSRLAAAGFTRARFDRDQAAARLVEVDLILDQLGATYELLGDESSRDLLVDVLLSRVLGPWHVRLPTSSAEFWRRCEEVERTMRDGEETIDSPFGLPLSRFRVPRRRGDVSFFGHPLQVVEFFLAEQYAYRKHGIEVAAEPGDLVVDGGGGWGETALYFADAVGREGDVLCLEFVAKNIELIERNLALNPSLEDRVRIVRRALWHQPGVELEFAEAGPMSSVLAAGEGHTTTSTIDELRSSGQAPIDFIKLDVEGAELQSLRGATATLERDRPKLAISAYHDLSDLVELPRFVDRLGLGYRFYLDHTTPWQAETILFCSPPDDR